MVPLPFFLGIGWGLVALFLPSFGVRILVGLTVGVGVLALFIAGEGMEPVVLWFIILINAWIPYMLFWGIGRMIERRRNTKPIQSELL